MPSGGHLDLAEDANIEDLQQIQMIEQNQNMDGEPVSPPADDQLMHLSDPSDNQNESNDDIIEDWIIIKG